MLDCLAMKGRLARVLGDDTSTAQADEMYNQLMQNKERDDA
jgi:hypothetical protein